MTTPHIIGIIYFVCVICMIIYCINHIYKEGQCKVSDVLIAWFFITVAPLTLIIMLVANICKNKNAVIWEKKDISNNE